MAALIGKGNAMRMQDGTLHLLGLSLTQSRDRPRMHDFQLKDFRNQRLPELCVEHTACGKAGGTKFNLRRTFATTATAYLTNCLRSSSGTGPADL
jgi:hypothetical protein